MLFGYARCSTNENRQDINRQVRELENQGVKPYNIYLEYEKGTKIDRVEFTKLFNAVKKGDTIVATEVSRITRSTQQLCEIIELAKQKQLCIVFGTFRVDCRTALDPMTEGMLKMMGVFSELERNIISQRVKSGMANAKEKGKKIGRTKTTVEAIPSIFFKYYHMYQIYKINKVEYARLCKISYPTLLKYLKIVEGQKRCLLKSCIGQSEL